MAPPKTWTNIEEAKLLDLAQDTNLSDSIIAKKMSLLFNKQFTERMIQNKRQRLGGIKKKAGRKFLADSADLAD